VSFLRDYNFWRENARKLGLDLDKLGKLGRFGFVDGLGASLAAVPTKGKPAAVDGVGTIQSFEAAAVKAELMRVIDGLSKDGAKVVLVIDQLDFAFAAGGNVDDLGDVLMDLREVSSSEHDIAVVVLIF
jgi:elongator complex protein 6